MESDRFPKRTSTTLYAGFFGPPLELAERLQQWAKAEKAPLAFSQWIAAWTRHPYTEPVVCSAYVTPNGSALVEGITASITPGVDRALATARTIEVTGVDLHAADQRLTARVCEVGPFLALKLRPSATVSNRRTAALLQQLPRLPGKSASAIPPARMRCGR